MSTTLPSTNVRRDGEKVWIDGAWGFDPSQYASSVHGAAARMCQAVGEGPTYDQLICYGGFAFRVQVHKEMCPSAGHPCPGYMCVENSNRSLPWKMASYDTGPWAKPAEDRAAFEREACAAIKKSIDRGIPVHYGSEEDGLIIGYAQDGKRWLCVHPYKWSNEAFWHDEAKGFAGGKWPWGIAVCTEPKPAAERPSKRDLTTAALKQAVEMWRTTQRGDYYCGDEAYARWLKWLTDVEAGTVADPKAGMQGNGWCLAVLVHSRRIAARWLKETANDYQGEARQQLLLAADHYVKLVEICMKELDSTWDLAPMPAKFDQWTSNMRKDEIARLTAAREHDKAAIAAIEKPLAAM